MSIVKLAPFVPCVRCRRRCLDFGWELGVEIIMLRARLHALRPCHRRRRPRTGSHLRLRDRVHGLANSASSSRRLPYRRACRRMWPPLTVRARRRLPTPGSAPSLTWGNRCMSPRCTSVRTRGLGNPSVASIQAALESRPGCPLTPVQRPYGSAGPRRREEPREHELSPMGRMYFSVHGSVPRILR